MIDLCIDARMAFSSGIGTCIRQLVPLLAVSPFRPILLVTQEHPEWPFEQILFPAPIYSAKEQLLFPLKIPKCDLFWSPHYNVPLLPVRAKKRIATLHDAYHLALGSPLEKIYAKLVMGHALHHSDATLTVSHFSKKEIQRYLGLPKKPLTVIPIAPKTLQPATNHPYNLPEKYILYVGNLKPHKNLSRLIEACSTISPDLVLVGKGPIEKQPRIWPLGEVADHELPMLYSKAQLFVFPSLYEGFGLPPLEAMSCGCPTVVSHAASLPEVCGPASLYFDPTKPHDIATAIQIVLSNPSLKNSLIQKGRERLKLFSWTQTAQAYRQVFEETLHA